MTESDYERILEWQGCYAGGWNGQIVPEAFAHPAKFGNGLIHRIIEHGLGRGYWATGDTIGDPFGGVAMGGIIAGYYGLNWRGVELEARFVDLGNQNLDLHRPKWKALGYDVDVRLVQGDSRNFASIVGQACGVVTSPPFADSDTQPTKMGSGRPTRLDGDSAGRNKGDYCYASSPGQIGRLKAGSVEACITSPPYAATPTTAGNVGNSMNASWGRGKRLGSKQEGYGHTNGNIGNLKQGSVDAVVTSPPWGKQNDRLDGDPDGNIYRKWCEQNGRDPRSNAARQMHDRYGQSEGQIGNSAGESYWQAMRAVYGQMHIAMKPGGVAAIGVKDYVKGGKRVPLCDDTLKLLLALGFDPIERVHAMLVKETVESTLFDGYVTKTKERKSFFRGLAEKKGSPRIDWEEVLFVRSPSFSVSSVTSVEKNRK